MTPRNYTPVSNGVRDIESPNGTVVELLETTGGTDVHVITPSVSCNIDGKKTKVSRRFVILCALVFILFVTSLAFAILYFQKVVSSSKPQKCETTDCLVAAAAMVQNMDPTVDPCTDFYSYSCGGFLHREVIPVGHTKQSQFTLIGEKILNIIYKELSWPVAHYSGARRKAKNAFERCVDLEALNRAKDALETQVLSKISPRWNIGEDPFPASYDKDSLAETMKAMYNSSTMGGYVSISIEADEKNITRNVIHIEQGGLSLSSKYYYDGSEKDQTAILQKFMMRVGKLVLGKDPVEAKIVAILDFERELAKIFIDDDELRNRDKYFSMTDFEEIQIMYPEVLKWKELLTFLLAIGDQVPAEKEPISITAEKYFQDLNELVGRYIKDDKIEVLHNYMLWQIIQKYVSSLSEEYRDAYEDFRNERTGRSGSLERWKECIGFTDALVGYATSNMFVERSFPMEAKSAADDMITGIEAMFRKRLISRDWMDATTREHGLLKLDKMSKQTGYPEFMKNATALDEYYEDFELNDNTTYLQVMLNFRYYRMRKSVKTLREARDKTKWHITPQTVNAYYAPFENQIVFTAAILQPPFFGGQLPEALNYGGMGVVIGHEILHGFDDTGSLYDGDGYLGNWWNNQTKEKFTKKSKCFVDQYNKYSIEGYQVNGNLTLGENLADGGGLGVAFNAYRATGSRTELPSVNINSDKLFFINFAQLWCNLQTKKSAQMFTVTNPHSPGRFRVNGALENNDDWADTFSCPRKKDKCEVW